MFGLDIIWRNVNVLAIYTVLTMISFQSGNKINKVSLLVHTCGVLYFYS
jgi:hypothetical protein